MKEDAPRLTISNCRGCQSLDLESANLNLKQFSLAGNAMQESFEMGFQVFFITVLATEAWNETRACLHQLRHSINEKESLYWANDLCNKKNLFIWLFTELISNSLWKYQGNMEVWYWAEAENGDLVTTVIADKEASALRVAVIALCFQPTSRRTSPKSLFSPLWGWALTIIPWSKKIPQMRLTKEPNQHMCKPQAKNNHEEEYKQVSSQISQIFSNHSEGWW